MSTTVNYKGNTIATVSNETKTLNTAGRWVEGDITLVDNSTANLQSKTVSYTPSETAQSATVTADSGYDGLGSVAVSVGAISGTYVGSQVPTQAAQTIHPSTSAQTIASGKYLTGNQTIEAVTTTNLTAANIKSGVVVKVGSATDDDSVLSVTGTAETGGAMLEDEVNTTGTTAVITGTEGGGSGISVDDIATNTQPSGAIVITSSSIKRAAFTYKPITAVESQTVTSIDTDAFRACTNLTSALFPNVTNITGGYAFAGCTKLSKIDFSKLQRIATSYIFMSDSALLTGVFPKLTYANQSFRSSGFITIDFGAQINISTYLFTTSSKLNKLILRSSVMCPLGDITAFNDTPFASGKAGGTIYIPKVLYDELGTGSSLDYKAATNWSTIDGYGTITWAAIEGSQYENYYADGTAIS